MMILDSGLDIGLLFWATLYTTLWGQS